jgi:hypothetical protein
MDFLEVLESGTTGLGGGGISQGLFQLLELWGCCQSVSHLTALLVAVIGLLDVSPNGNDPTWSWHLQYQVGVMRNRHQLDECRPSQQSVVRSLKIIHLKFYSFSLEVLPSLEGYGKRDLTDGHRCYTGNYTVERSPTSGQKRSRQPHQVKSLQKKEVDGVASIHEHSVELNVLYNGADYQGIPPRLWYKVRMVPTIEGNGDLSPSKVWS